MARPVSKAEQSAVIVVLKVLGKLFGIWPVEPSASRCERICSTVAWWVYVINCVTIIPASVASATRHTGDFVKLMRSLVELLYLSESLVNLIYSNVRRSQLQDLLWDLESSYWTLSPRELALKRRLSRCTMGIYTVTPTLFLTTALIFIFSPLALPDRKVPLNTVYPFPIEESWGLGVTYGLNVMGILVATIAVLVDLGVVTVLWHASFKFKLVERKVGDLVFESQMRQIVREHQRALRYAKDADYLVNPVIAKTIVTTSFYMISCGLLLLNKIPLLDTTQFFAIAFLSCVRLYICSWAADVLTRFARDVSWAIYDAPWIDWSPKFRGDLLPILQRCQRPVTISLGNFVPAVSLRFFQSVMYTTFSYFLTLRAILKV